MAKKEVITYSQQTFENIKHTDENGTEFWYARELQKALEYTEYGKFLPVIKKAIEACRKTGFDEENHFAHVSEMDGTCCQLCVAKTDVYTACGYVNINNIAVQHLSYCTAVGSLG